jgi:hypothetical protein
MDQQQIFNKLLETLHDDLAFYSPMIKEVAQEMMKEKFTAYPIFIAHQHEVKIGELILSKDDFARDFSINACTLEALVEAKMILPERKNDFIQNFQNPKTTMCILLVLVSGAHFVFVPYAIKAKPKDETN